jgi:hypothetical protein
VKNLLVNFYKSEGAIWNISTNLRDKIKNYYIHFKLKLEFMRGRMKIRGEKKKESI